MKPVAWIKSPNFTAGRSGRRPDVIVIHVMEGTLEGTASWFRSPNSKVSAHYGIGMNRVVHQYVSEDDQAWHAGRVDRPTARLVKARPGVNPNSYSFGIEHEGTADSVWPQTMYVDSAALVAEIATRWSIPLDRDHVIGHREIFAAKTCPGKGDVERIIRLAVALRSKPRILRLGMSGDDVAELQRAMGAPVTSVYDAITDAWVRGFQRGAGLVVDGDVGPATRTVLGI